MLTPEQKKYFDTFGFIILRDIFTPEDVKTIRSEFDVAAKRASEFEPFDGTKMHYFNRTS